MILRGILRNQNRNVVLYYERSLRNIVGNEQWRSKGGPGRNLLGAAFFY